MKNIFNLFALLSYGEKFFKNSFDSFVRVTFANVQAMEVVYLEESYYSPMDIFRLKQCDQMRRSLTIWKIFIFFGNFWEGLFSFQRNPFLNLAVFILLGKFSLLLMTKLLKIISIWSHWVEGR